MNIATIPTGNKPYVCNAPKRSRRDEQSVLRSKAQESPSLQNKILRRGEGWTPRPVRPAPRLDLPIPHLLV